MKIYQFRFVVYFVQRRGPSRQSPDKCYSACGRKEDRQSFVDVLTEPECTENGVSPCSESVLKR